MPDAGENIFQLFALNVAPVEGRIDPNALPAPDMPERRRRAVGVVVDERARRGDEQRPAARQRIKAGHLGRELLIEPVDELAITTVGAIDLGVEP